MCKRLSKHTEVVEIQGEKPPKPVAPPPTAQTPWPNLFIFWREPPHVNAFRGTEAIFEFHSWSRDISQKLPIFEPQSDPSKTPKCAHISGFRMKFKNRLGAPESIHMRGLVPKNEPIRPRRLGCRGGCYGFWWFSPYISLNSVVEIFLNKRRHDILAETIKECYMVEGYFWYLLQFIR